MKAFAGITLALLVMATRPVSAQDPIRLTAIGTGRGLIPVAVFAGRGLDSVRAIVQRDLQNSDRFLVTVLSDSMGRIASAFDSVTVKGLGALTLIVELQPSAGGVDVKLWDVPTGIVRQQATKPADVGGVGDSRITIHRISDQIVNWTGGVGIAASRIAFKMKNGTDDAIWRIDNDGANLVRVSRSGLTMTPTWSPDGSSIAYSRWADGRWSLIVQKLATATSTQLTSMTPGDMYGGRFSPDGRSMVFTFIGQSAGSVIETVDVVRNCCAHELTHDRRNADNSDPSYSSDGRRIAYISTKSGTPQIYGMDDDGTNSEMLVQPDYDDRGHALDSYSPAWSPDGTKLVFTRETRSGARQVWKWSAGSSQAVQVTSHGQNEDPSWAPDSRHIVFKSRQTGREQLFIYDIESGNSRQLNTPGGAQYPAWSRVLGTNP